MGSPFDFGSRGMDWERCLRVANHLRYWGGIHAEDGEDFVQDALLEMMERASRNGGLSTKEIWRAARCVRNRYWRAYDRGKRMVSLNARINGTGPELWETIPDKTIDLAAWADARAEILKCPPRILATAAKRVAGLPLTSKERKCLIRFQRKMGKARSLVPILGERCKELRERQGWTREKLALRSMSPTRPSSTMRRDGASWPGATALTG